MKVKSIVSIVLLLFVSVLSNAQDGYELSVEKRLLNGVDSSVFVLEVDRAVEHDVKKAWDKLIKQNGKVKPVVKNDLISVSGITISSIDSDPLDMYVSIVQQDTSVKLYSSYIVDSVRVDPRGKEGTSVKIRKMLANFGNKVYKEVLEREIEEKKDILNGYIKGRGKNLKEQDDLVNSIQRDSLKISNAETEIGLHKGQLKGVTERYTAQKNRMATAKYADKDQAKEEKGKLKDLDKERKGIEKDIEKETEKIVNLKADIRDYWFKLNQLKEDLTGIESDILKQIATVQDAQEALEKH